jgi:hypothetical protein
LTSRTPPGATSSTSSRLLSTKCISLYIAPSWSMTQLGPCSPGLTRLGMPLWAPFSGGNERRLSRADEQDYQDGRRALERRHSGTHFYVSELESTRYPVMVCVTLITAIVDECLWHRGVQCISIRRACSVRAFLFDINLSVEHSIPPESLRACERYKVSTIRADCQWSREKR